MILIAEKGMIQNGEGIEISIKIALGGWEVLGLKS
jgi:hypothetical protein